MKARRLALIQTCWPGKRQEIMETYRDLIREAAKLDADIVCLPEFSLSPYFASSKDKSGFTWAEFLNGGPSAQFFSEQSKLNKIHLIGSLFERGHQNQYWDTATIHNPNGEMIGYTHKVHIPQGEGYHEDHFFEGDQSYPIHTIADVPTATPTCYDQWFPEMSRICTLNGAELICYPTAIGSEITNAGIDSKDAWQIVMRGQAVANGIYIAAANRTGREQITFYGSSFICDPMGNIIAQATRDRTEIITADLDPNLFNEWRRLFPLMKRRRPDTYHRLVDSV